MKAATTEAQKASHAISRMANQSTLDDLRLKENWASRSRRASFRLRDPTTCLESSRLLCSSTLASVPEPMLYTREHYSGQSGHAF